MDEVNHVNIVNLSLYCYVVHAYFLLHDDDVYECIIKA